MTPMCDVDTGEMVGWAVAVADCDGDVTFEYFDEDGVTQGASLPTDWKPCMQGLTGPEWAPTHNTETYTASMVIDFAGPEYISITLGGNLELTSSNHSPAREIKVRIVEGTGVSRTITPDSSWKFVGSAAPTTLIGTKTALLTLISFGVSATNVVAIWEVQS